MAKSKRIGLILPVILCIYHAHAQKPLTPEAAIQATLQNHPLAKAATASAKAKTFNEKAALNLPNPEINAESPTGEFYAVGLLQSFEFPTVYARQKSVAKAETELARTNILVNANDLRHATRALYLEAQIAETNAAQARQRDSVFQQIRAAAQRQFAAGDIDFLQKTWAENEAGKTQQAHLAAQNTAKMARMQLATFTRLDEVASVLPLTADTLAWALASLQNNRSGSPTIAFEQQAVKVADEQVRLARSKALPDFSVGYLNQGARETPLDYRFRATVGIPLWAGQYKAATKSAQTEAEAARERANAQQQAIAMELARTETDMDNARTQIRYYRNEALPRSQALRAAATRMREAGQIDYPAYLRTLDEVFATQQAFTEQLAQYEAARIAALHLIGQ